MCLLRAFPTLLPPNFPLPKTSCAGDVCLLQVLDHMGMHGSQVRANLVLMMDKSWVPGLQGGMCFLGATVPERLAGVYLRVMLGLARRPAAKRHAIVVHKRWRGTLGV